MTLSQEILIQRLAPRQVRYYAQVNSTQDIAQQWLREGAEAGAIVIADEQFGGRGRLGRHWSTPPGVALAVSMILYPSRAALPQVTMLGALAISELLDEFGAVDVAIKWPNDVRLNGRKVSGVLPEVVWEGEKLLGVTLGMGINVRNDFSGSPLAHTAISIEDALNAQFNRVDLLEILVTRLDHWANFLGAAALYTAWKRRLDTLGQQVTMRDVTGIAEEVTPDGTLLVRDSSGTLRRVIAGDIQAGT